MTSLIKHFIIVDDDPVYNLLSKMALKKLLGKIVVEDFVDPELALMHIKTEFEHKQREKKTTLLLDINMPSITGWEFLDKFQTYKESIKNQLTIYIVSSSIDPGDIQRAKQNPLVIDFIEKPLNKSIILKTFI